MLLTEVWVKMGLNNHDKEDWRKFLWLLQPIHARSDTTGKQVLPGPWHRGAEWNSPQPWQCRTLPSGPIPGWLLSSVITVCPRAAPVSPWCSAGLAQPLLSSKYSYSNKSVFIISPLVSKLQLWYLHSIYLNFIGVFS